jgi:hypothetical protein
LAEFNQFVSDSVETCEEDFFNTYSPSLNLKQHKPSWVFHLIGRETHPMVIEDMASYSDNSPPGDLASDVEDDIGESSIRNPLFIT